jgi:hypothetical protein
VANYETEREVRSIIGPTERLVWAGRPKQGLMFRTSDIFMIPFSLMWCGFAVFWELSVLGAGAPLLFKLWGVPFVLVGLYFVVGRFLADARIRRHTVYGITDNRVVIRSGLFSQRLNSLSLRTLSGVSLDESNNGRGTIYLGPRNGWQEWQYGTWLPSGNSGTPKLIEIDDAKRVYDDLMAAQKDA